MITWSDPMICSRAIKSMSGLEYLRSLRDGRSPLPPMYGLFNFRFLEVEAGRVLFEATPTEYQCNPVGIVHGGFACTALDSATACAVLSLLPANADLASLEVKVNFVRPVKVENGTVRCEGRVIHAGKRIATAEGKMKDEKGNLYAHAVSTCLISRPDS
jgi:uncharacterized protein (TIGR00369 family)